MRRLTLSISGLLCGVVAGLLPWTDASAAATSIVWDGDTSTDFTASGNWTGNVAPTNDLATNIATFSTASPTFQPSLAGTYSVNGVSMTGGYTLSGAGTLKIGSGGVTAMGTNTISVSSLTLGAATTMSLAGTTTISSGINTNGFNLALTRTGTGSLDLTNSVISGSGNVSFNAGSFSNIISVGGANSFTGTVNISETNLNFTTLANGASASSFGAGTTTVTIGGQSSFAEITNIGTGGSTDRLFVVSPSGSASSGAGIVNNGSGALSFNNTGTYGSLPLSLSGSYTGGVNTFAETVTGTANVGKAGASTWALTGTNTYTGTTTVSAGSLLINGSVSGSAVSASSGGTIGGAGSITTNNEAFTLASGAKLDPGANGITGLSVNTGTGALDITGAIGGSNTGSLLFNLDTTSDSDTLTLTSGALNIGGGLLNLADFNFTFGSGFGVGTYTLFNLSDTTATLNGSLATTGLTGQVDGLGATLSVSGNDIVLTVVPEPNAAISLLGGLGILLCLKRRRA